MTIPVSFKTPSDTTPTIIVQGNGVTINQDTPPSFNFTHVIDPDVGDIQTTTINVLHGTLNLTSVAGLSSFSGYGTNSITIVGPTAAVDAIVDAGVTYTPNDDYSGSDTLTIKDTDSFGGSATQQIAITVKPNEAPVLNADVSGPHAITELTGKTGDAADNDTASGTLSFTDVNFFDTHTVSTSVHSITWSGGGALPSGLAAVLASALSTSVTTDSASMVSSTGSIGFTFSAADRNFDFLAKDETLTVTYDVTVKDDDNAISTQPVTITITGTNDAPVINAIAAAPLTEQTDTTPLTTTIGVTFTDADLTDVGHTAAITHAVATGVTTGLALDQAGLMALVTPETVLKASGSSSGSVNLDFSAASTAFNYLAVGEVVTLTFTVAIDDHHGGVTPQTFVVTVTGTDDAPVINAIAQKDLTEQTDTNPLTATIGVTFTDADLTDVGHTAAITHAVATGVTTGLALDEAGLIALVTPETVLKASGSSSGSVNLDFSAASTAFDYLAAGEVVTLTYTVAIDDHHGGVTPQTFVVTVTGTNDAPVLALNNSGSVSALDQIPVTLAPALTLGDVDSVTLAFAKVQITGNYASTEDVLSFTDTSKIHGSWDAATGTLTLTAISGQTPTDADFQAALSTVTYTDTSGNPSTADRTVTFTVRDPNGTAHGGVDTATATATIQVTPLNLAITAITNDTGTAGDFITSDTTLVVSGTNGVLGGGEKVQITSNGTNWFDVTQNTGTSWTYNDTANPHFSDVTYQVRVIDAANNVSDTASRLVVIDTTPPAAPTVALASDTGSSGSDHITSNGLLTVTPAEAGGTIQYSTDGGINWTGSFTAVEGANAVKVRQVDAAGNNGAAASFSFTLDTTPPAAPTVALASDTGSSGSDHITSNGLLTVTPAEAGGTIQYSTDGGINWTGSFTAVEGANAIKVRQVDAAGNNGAAASFSFTLDTTPPAAPTVALASDTGSSGSDHITSNGLLTVTPAEAGGTIQYSTDGGINWTGSFTAVEGANAVKVRQVDAAGNNGAAASFSFTLDTTPPAAPTVALASDTGSSGSDHITSNGLLTVTPAEAGGTIQYSTDGGINWTGSFAAVEGANAVKVRQVDAAGNNGAAASFSFTLDTTPPAAPTVALASDTGSSGSDHITSNGLLTVTPAEAGGTIQYSTDGGINWTGSFAAVEGANAD